ncbi:MAG: histidine phosphatase family protein [Gemmatimonadota bacterium]
MMRRRPRGGWVWLAWVLAVGVPGLGAQTLESTTTVYLVRHAERAQDDPSDPTLTPGGTERSALLARMLRDVPLTSVFSSDYRRTRLTAGPVAREHHLEIQLYDPRDEGLEALADRLRTTPGHHLVVGHSNTTPTLVEALGGDPRGGIAEDEYDRLYVVVLAGSAPPSSSLLRFGAPSTDGGER